VSQSRIQFQSNGKTLEGIISVPKKGKEPLPCVVLCPPHPYLHGGMEVPVLNVLSSSLQAAGVLVLRFNYRGVGDSQGEFTNGKGEFLDIRSAMDTLAQWPNANKKCMGLVAYSFGASVALRSFDKLREVKAIALLSPPPSSLVGHTQLRKRTPIYILVGDRDRIAPIQKISEIIIENPQSFNCHVINGADHSWDGAEDQAAEKITQFLIEFLSH
jgi:alpha/beta superfamily hydrolase